MELDCRKRFKLGESQYLDNLKLNQRRSSRLGISGNTANFPTPVLAVLIQVP